MTFAVEFGRLHDVFLVHFESSLCTSPITNTLSKKNDGLLRISSRQSDEWIMWTSPMATATFTEQDVDFVHPTDKSEVLKFARNVYSVLLSCTENDPVRICHSGNAGNGLTVIRLLMKRYEPRTPGTRSNRALGFVSQHGGHALTKGICRAAAMACARLPGSILLVKTLDASWDGVKYSTACGIATNFVPCSAPFSLSGLVLANTSLLRLSLMTCCSKLAFVVTGGALSCLVC